MSRSKFLELSYFVLVGILLLAGQCKKAKSISSASDKSATGVMLIKNHLKPLFNNGLELISNQTIGSERKGQYILVNPSKLAVDDEGQIYVLDSRDSNIKVFNRHGQYLRLIGRKGEGPGELISPVLMIIYKRSELVVYDARLRRLTHFSNNGSYLRSNSTATFSIADLRSDSQGNIICLVPVLEPGQIKYELRKYDSFLINFSLIDATDWLESDKFQLFKGSASFFVTPQDLIVFGISQKYEIRIFDDDGILQKRIQKDYVPIPIPRSDIDNAMKGFPMEIKTPIPDYYDPFYRLYGDDEGRIIVETRVQITGSKKHFYDVFDSAGLYLTTISLKSHRDCLWKNNKLYMIEENKEGMPIINIYQINWKS